MTEEIKDKHPHAPMQEEPSYEATNSVYRVPRYTPAAKPPVSCIYLWSARMDGQLLQFQSQCKRERIKALDGKISGIIHYGVGVIGPS